MSVKSGEDHFGKKSKLKGLWIHSIASAVAAKVIGQNILYREIEELFICGLLHDIGKIVEYRFYPKDVEKAAKKCKDEKKYYFEVEKEIFGVGHERIGQLLLTKWRLPEKFAKVAGFHHHPNLKQEYALETGIIFIADALVRHMNLGDTLDSNKVPKVKAEHLKMAGLRILEDKKIIEAINGEVEEVVNIFIKD